MQCNADDDEGRRIINSFLFSDENTHTHLSNKICPPSLQPTLSYPRLYYPNSLFGYADKEPGSHSNLNILLTKIIKLGGAYRETWEHADNWPAIMSADIFKSSFFVCFFDTMLWPSLYASSTIQWLFIQRFVEQVWNRFP